MPELEPQSARVTVVIATRNVGVERSRTPYVALCDDNSWWVPGALERGVSLLDADPAEIERDLRLLERAERSSVAGATGR